MTSYRKYKHMLRIKGSKLGEGIKPKFTLWLEYFQQFRSQE
jgi:hypothetical protein